MADFVLPWSIGDHDYFIYCILMNFIKLLEGYKESSEAISKITIFFFSIFISHFPKSLVFSDPEGYPHW